MMKRPIFITAGLLFSLTFWCQDWSLKLSSNVEIRTWKLTSTYEKEEKSLGGAKIVLTKGNETISQTTSDGQGDFTINVPPNGEFLLTVSYPGFNTKRFSVNTNNVPADFAKDNWKPTFSIGGFIMARAYPGIDYSGLEKPLVLVEFKQKKKVFDHDDIVTQGGLNTVMKIYESEDALIKKFCSTNKAGDVALAKPDCPLAKKLYQEAMAMIPFETYPGIQLQKVGECLKNQSDAQAKAAEEAAKKAAAEKAAADKAAADKLAAGDKAAADKAAAAQKAAEEKDANAKAQAEADAAAKAKAEAKAEKERKQKEGLAKSKAEDDAAAKADEEKRKQREKENAEAAAKAKADELANAKAKAEEKKEKERKQKEGLAKAKAEDEAEAKAIADKREAERKAKEEEAKKLSYETESTDPQGEMGKGNGKVSVPQTVFGVDKYKTAIKRADELFKMKRWSEAKTAYEEALTIKKDDPYATSKLEIVNKNLAPK